ncbi:transglutaminase domain-containing protein [Jejudonia soesokkakensis]|uniref:Transglutaminase domain-containing protein n=1 Tax=Jejudonia soesokkakensis TaxID=1323432 RepID=A0ABW2MPG0_9FLAO
MNSTQQQIVKFSVIIFIFFNAQFVVSQDYRFGKVSKEELLQKEHPEDNEADAAILYREVSTSFDYSQDNGFYLVTDVFERIKIYNKEGFDWGTKKVNLKSGNGSREKISGLKGNTYFLEGDKIEDEKLRNDGIFDVEVHEYLEQTKFTMPNLKEGCVIEYKYTVRSPYIGNVDTYRLQEKIPLDKVEVRFAAPEYLNYKTHRSGWLPFRIDQEIKQRNLTLRTKKEITQVRTSLGQGIIETQKVEFKDNVSIINLEDVPAMKKEAYIGNIDNYAAAIKFELAYTKFPGASPESYATTWEAVSKSIYDSSSFGEELKRSNYFEDDIDAIVKTASSTEEKMNLVFEYVKSKMTWNDYFGYYASEGLKNAYKQGTGNIADINLMLVAMLRHVGLNANPVLISSKANGIPLFPSRNGFNYVIAAVEENNEIHLLDATNKKGEIDILETEILNWQGRILRDDNSSDWVPLYPSAPATESALVTIDINDDLTLDGSIKSRYTGHYALSKRFSYSNISEEDQRKKLEKDKGEVEFSNIKFENLETINQPVTLNYDFTSYDAVEEIGGKIYVSPLSFLAVKETPFKSETRNYPIDFSHPLKDRYLFTINLPEGYKVETLPESVAFSLGEESGEFRYAVTNNNNTLKISMELSINQPYIGAEAYGGLKKFFELLVEKQNEKVVLVKA